MLKSYKFLLIAVLIFLFLNINVSSTLSKLNVDVTGANARQWSAPDMNMVEETCLVTGKIMLICRSQPDWYCVISTQDSCSATD